MASRTSRIELVVSKWGNSLAVRLPAASARRIGVGEGDTLIAEISSDGKLILAREGKRVDPRAVAALRRAIAHQKETPEVVAHMRRRERY